MGSFSIRRAMDSRRYGCNQFSVEAARPAPGAAPVGHCRRGAMVHADRPIAGRLV